LAIGYWLLAIGRVCVCVCVCVCSQARPGQARPGRVVPSVIGRVGG